MKYLFLNILSRLNSSFFKKLLIRFLFLFLFFVFVIPAFSQTAKEYEIKSVLLEKISRFITWPENTGTINKSAPFIIGVLGKNPFEKTLENIFSTYPIHGKKVQVKYYSALHEVTTCNILFISSSEKGKINELIEYFNSKPVLLVGDTKGYFESGVHVFFYINKENELRFRINVDAIRRSNLTANSFLLDYANKE